MVKYNLFFFPSEEQRITKLSESHSREGADTAIGPSRANTEDAAARQRRAMSFCFAITTRRGPD